GLLTLAAQALALRPHVRLTEAPRMADFAHWGEAAARALGYGEGRVLGVLKAKADKAASVTLDATPLTGAPERALSRAGVSGRLVSSATDLLVCLNEHATESERRHPGWPRSANKLSGTLRRLAANLRRAGIDYADLPRSGSAGRRLAVWLTVYGPPAEV